MFNFAFIVPTGIGAAVGGYAGDAGIVVKYLASQANWVLTHPNAVNAAIFYEQPPQVQYLEGAYLDGFFLEEIGFRRVHSQKIGLVIDRRCEAYLPILPENAKPILDSSIQVLHENQKLANSFRIKIYQRTNCKNTPTRSIRNCLHRTNG